MKRYIPRIAFLLTVILAGCTSPSGGIKNASPVSISKSLSLDFIQVETASSAGNLPTERLILSDSIMSGLNETGLFNDVSTNKPESGPVNGIKIRADIQSIKKVSDSARIWAGAWAGEASIVVHVTFSNITTGQTIEIFDAEGESGKSAWAGTTEAAIHLATERIVAEVVKINAQTAQ